MDISKLLFSEEINDVRRSYLTQENAERERVLKHEVA